MFRLGLPLMVTDVIMLVYTVTDAFWLGRYDKYALAVPAQCWPLFLVFVSLVMGITAANLAILSQYVGAKMFDRVSEVSSKLLTFCILVSTLLFVLYETLRFHIFYYLVRVPEEILDDVLSYAEVIAFDVLWFGLALTLSTIMQSLGDTRTPAMAMGLGALSNAVLDPIFILGMGPVPSMGARGAAIATVITRIFGVTLMLFVIRARYREIRLRPTSRIDREWVTLSIKVGLPVTLMTALDGFAFTFLRALINIFGVVATTVFAIGLMAIQMATAFLRGFTMSISIMIGQNLGAGNTERARRIALTAAHTIMPLVLACSAAVFLARNILVTFFTSDPIIVAEAEKLVSTIAWILPLMMLSFLGMSIGRGSGHNMVPTVINIVRFWVIRIGVGWILAVVMGLGLDGIWMAIVLSELVGGTATYVWIRRGGWAKPIIKTCPPQVGIAEVAKPLPEKGIEGGIAPP